MNTAVKTRNMTKTELKSRGWTDALISRLLGGPDTVKKRHGGGTITLYSEPRVLEAEKLSAYAEGVAAAKIRSARSKASSERQREKNIASVDDVQISVHRIPLEELRDLAIEHAEFLWHRRHRDAVDAPNFRDAPELDIQRWMVNYVRHEFTSYEDILESTRGQVGVWQMSRKIKGRILDEIAKVYPELQSECNWQAFPRYIEYARKEGVE